MVLAIEAATPVCSVAFKNAGGKVYEKRIKKRGAHSEKLFLFLQALMKEQKFGLSNIQAVLVSEGPGSYTGLRISASAVKGLLFDSKVPLYSVQTLASYARGALKQYPEAVTIHSVIDARRVHLYHQAFKVQGGNLTASGAVAVRPIEQVTTMVQPNDVIIGTGLNRLDAKMLEKANMLDADSISARSLIDIYEESQHTSFVEKQDPALFTPKYYTSGQVG